jgi:CRISPR-associated protein Csm2
MPSIQDIKEKTSKYRTNLYDELRIEDAIEYAEAIAIDMQMVKTHQIRRFFSAIKNIQKKVINVEDEVAFPADEYAELQMLRPQLANAVGRLHGQEKMAMKNLLEILQPIFKTVKTNKDFARFVNFFESIVAYHKVYAKQ